MKNGWSADGSGLRARLDPAPPRGLPGGPDQRQSAQERVQEPAFVRAWGARCRPNEFPPTLGIQARRCARLSLRVANGPELRPGKDAAVRRSLPELVSIWGGLEVGEGSSRWATVSRAAPAPSDMDGSRGVVARRRGRGTAKMLVQPRWGNQMPGWIV